MTPLERFESRIERIPEAGCWLWLGSTKSSKWNYGKLWLNGVLEGAHRAAWILYHGEIPIGRYVCHRCDVPLCVNPGHLFLGDARSNMRDMIAKGRDREGHIAQSQKLAKFTPDQVSEIRASPLSFGKLAKLYGVSRGCIQHIKQYRTYKVAP